MDSQTGLPIQTDHTELIANERNLQSEPMTYDGEEDNLDDIGDSI